MFLVGIKSGALKRRYTYLCYQKYSQIGLEIKPDSLIIVATDELEYILVMV